jgi:hypothetical protein
LGVVYAPAPDPGCTEDCIDRLVWGILLVLWVGAWSVGLVLGVISGWLAHRNAEDER